MLRAVRFCLMLEGQEGVTWDHWLALAETAERLGFDGLFRSDHYFSAQGVAGRGSTDAWTLLGALAARTERIRLGTLVSPVTFRPPAVLAKSAATVDEISAGRVEIGMGAGWWTEEHTQFGFPFPPTRERFAMLEEQLQIVHGLFTDDRFSFRGAHYTLDGADFLPKPVQRPRPPILLGGTTVGPWMQRLDRRVGRRVQHRRRCARAGPRAIRSRSTRRRGDGTRSGVPRHIVDDVVLRCSDQRRLPRDARARENVGSQRRSARGVSRRHRSRLHRGNPGAGGRTVVRIRGRRCAARDAESPPLRRPRDARTPCRRSVSERSKDVTLGNHLRTLAPPMLV